MFHIHKWTDWYTIESGTGEYVFGRGHAMYIYQRRVCQRCKKIELNKQVV